MFFPRLDANLVELLGSKFLRLTYFFRTLVSLVFIRITTSPLHTHARTHRVQILEEIGAYCGKVILYSLSELLYYYLPVI